MGKALLSGFLNNLQTGALAKLRYEVAVTSTASAERLQKAFADHKDRAEFTVGKNVEVVQRAGAVVLAFRPDQLQSILSQSGMSDALHGKLIISILAGISPEEIIDQLSCNVHVVRVMPSMGAQAYESTTLTAADQPPLPADLKEFTETLFESSGKIYTVPSDLYDSIMAFTTVCHAMMAIAIDALVDGGAAAGIPGELSLPIAAQCFQGYAKLLGRGDEPAELKKSILIPNGFTVNSILRLERKGMRSAVSDTVVETVATVSSNRQ